MCISTVFVCAYVCLYFIFHESDLYIVNTNTILQVFILGLIFVVSCSLKHVYVSMDRHQDKFLCSFLFHWRVNILYLSVLVSCFL